MSTERVRILDDLAEPERLQTREVPEVTGAISERGDDPCPSMVRPKFFGPAAAFAA
jgi:hypothetical protein